MESCGNWLLLSVAVGGAGWGMALWWRARARRYSAAFDRAFEVARRVYDFTESEKEDFARIIGRPLQQDPTVN